MRRMLITAFLGMAMTTAVVAEPVGFQDGAFSRPEAIVGVGLTIPFGATHKQDAPRVELRLARDVVNADGSRLASNAPDKMEARIGIALAPDHKLMLNGRSIEQDRRQGVSTIGWVAIGVGVAVIAAGVATWEALEASSE